ncbi:MAG: hypothetical protein GY762_07315 [Proteobacteria bacterium]|nr:hypothetical protein [Pseudomonadota bacterium]
MKNKGQQTAAPAKRPRRRRLALALLLPPSALILVVLGALLFILGTPMGTNLALSRGLEEYNQIIPGSINVEKISGTVLFGPRMKSVSLVDRNGDPMVTASELLLDIDPLALAAGTVRVESLVIRSADVYLRNIDNKSSFGDLAPADDRPGEVPEPVDAKDADLPSAPRLPFDLVVDQLDISNTTLYSVADDNPDDPPKRKDTGNAQDTIVHAEKLTLYCRWNGGDGAVHITHIKASVPPADIEVYNTDLAATLRDGRFGHLNHSRITTNRGTVSLEEAAYDIAATEGEARVTVTTDGGQLNTLLASLPRDRTISLQLHLALLADVVELTGRGRSRSSELHFKGAAGLAPELNGELAFDLKKIEGALFVPKLKADLSGTGHLQLHHTDEGSMDGSVTFAGRSNTVSPVGQIGIHVDGVQDRDTLRTTLRLRSDHGRASIHATLKNFTHMTVNWNVRVGRLSPFANAFSLPKTTGTIFTTGSCRGTVDTPACNVRFDAQRLAIGGIRLETLDGNSAFSFGKTGFSVQGRANLRNLLWAGQVLKELDLAARKTDAGFDVTVDAIGRRDNTATVLMHVIQGSPALVRISQLRSGIGEVPLELDAPVEIQLGKEVVSIVGGQLLVGTGTVSLRGDLSRQGEQNLKLGFQGMDLEIFSSFTGGVALTGVVDGSMVLTGTTTKPELVLALRSNQIKVNAKSIVDVRIDGCLKNDQADVTTSIMDQDTALASFHLSVPVRLNLATSELTLLKQKPLNVAWNIADLNNHHVADWMPDPALEFKLHGNGKLTITADGAVGQGAFNGSVGYANSEQTLFSTTARLSSTAQKISFMSPGPDGNPISVEMDLKISIPKLLDNVFDMGRSHLVAKIGDATMHATATYLGESHFGIDLKFTHLDLSRLNPYLENPNLSLGGIGSGSGRITLLHGAVTANIEASIENVLISKRALGDLSLDTTWQGDRLTVRADLQNKTRSLFGLRSSLPLINDPKPGQDRWQSNENLSIRWSLNRLDLATLAPVLDFPPEFTGEVTGEGVLSGVIDELFGYVTLDASIRYGDLLPLEIAVNGDLQSRWQKIKVEIESEQQPTGLLDIRYDGNLGNIVRGEQLAEEAPIAARFNMEDFDLEQLNPFMPSGFYDIDGQASAEVTLKGTLANPTIEGKVTLEETEIAVAGLSNPLTHINATLEFSDKDIHVNKFQFDSGRGTATATAEGTITAWNRYAIYAEIESKKLALGLSGLPPLKMDTKINVDLGRAEDTLAIDVRIGKTVVVVEDWVKGSVKPAPTNPNIVLVEKKKRPKKKQETTQTAVDLKVATTTPLRLTGSLLDTTWNVDLKVATGKEPTRIDGKANIVRGSFDILGNAFNVEEADLIFTEAAGGEPFLNMIATTDFPDTEVKATIRGRVSNPELTLTSIPAMSEADIFSLLLVGTTDMDQGGSKSANLLAGVATMKAPVMKKAMRTAGISQFSVGDAREGEGQVMSVGTRLRPDLVMVVTINLNAKEGENESELRFKYDISKNWKFETGVGPAYTSVDFFWHVPLKHKRSEEKEQPEKNPD